MQPSELISFFFRLQTQIQILHWQTESFARHTAYGQLYEEIGDLVDTFMEVYQGKNGRVVLPENFSVTVYNINDEKVNTFIQESIDFLNKEIPSLLAKDDTDLLNIRDEILANFNKLRYLLTLS